MPTRGCGPVGTGGGPRRGSEPAKKPGDVVDPAEDADTSVGDVSIPRQANRKLVSMRRVGRRTWPQWNTAAVAAWDAARARALAAR